MLPTDVQPCVAHRESQPSSQVRRPTARARNDTRASNTHLRYLWRCAGGAQSIPPPPTSSHHREHSVDMSGEPVFVATYRSISPALSDLPNGMLSSHTTVSSPTRSFCSGLDRVERAHSAHSHSCPFEEDDAASRDADAVYTHEDAMRGAAE